MKKTIISILLLGFILPAVASELHRPAIKVTKTTYNETHKFGELQLKQSGGTVTYYLNADGNICHKREGDEWGRKETAGFYENGNIIKEIITRPWKATLEDGIIYDTISIKTWKYANGKVVEVVETKPKLNSNGAKYYDTVAMETWVYDKAGREIDVCEYKDKKLTERSRYEYNSAGYKKLIYDGNGKVTFEIDKKGNEIYAVSKEDPQAAHYVYNSNGELIEQTDGAFGNNGVVGRTKYYTYDKYGNVTSVGNGIGSSVRRVGEKRYTNDYRSNVREFKYDYDPYGNIKTMYFVDQDKRIVSDIVYAKTDADYASVGQMIKNDMKVYDDVLYNKEYKKLLKEKEERDAREADVRKMNELKQRDSVQIVSHFISRKILYDQLQNKLQNRFIFQPYSSGYPSIFSTIKFIDKNGGSEHSEPNGYVYHTCDRYYVLVEELIRAQEFLVNTVLNPKNKKEMNSLEKSLKKADSYGAAARILSNWLADRGCKVDLSLTGGVSTDLYNSKENIEKRLSRYGNVWKTTSGLSLTYTKNWLLSSDKSSWTKEGVEKAIEINTFVYKLYTDESLKAEREAFEKQLENLDKRAETAHISTWTIGALMFEEFIKEHGIIIPGR